MGEGGIHHAYGISTDTLKNLSAAFIGKHYAENTDAVFDSNVPNAYLFFVGVINTTTSMLLGKKPKALIIISRQRPVGTTDEP